jgi:exopolysaccharide biosynthesis protein
MEKYRENDSDYNVARVTIQDPSQLRTALAGAYGTQRTNRVSNLAGQYNAVVAMNGDYYLNRTAGYIVRQGETYRKKPVKNKDMLIIDDRGDFHILKNSDADQLKTILDSDSDIINAFTFGPALVIDGVLQDMPKEYEFNIRGREPRSAIGQLDTLTYLMVVVDGRSNRNKGITVAQLADFMQRMGCEQALNMDGGNTAALVFNSMLYCDKSNSGERSISDIIYFASAVPPAE